MKLLSDLLNQNKKWSEEMRKRDPKFFQNLIAQQSPNYFWIGCSDSRVPANQIVDLLPGELFVHRNVANQVVHTDLNCLSALQYAVDTLKVKHVIVCGHYGCGGIRAAMEDTRAGLVSNWLRHVQDVQEKHFASIRKLNSFQEKWDRLTELNVTEQVLNVCRTTVIQDAWSSGREINVHGWIYGIGDGRLRDLAVTIGSEAEFTSFVRGEGGK